MYLKRAQFKVKIEENLVSEALLGTSDVLFELGARRAERVHVLLVKWTAAVAHKVGELLRVCQTRNLVLVIWPEQRTPIAND